MDSQLRNFSRVVALFSSPNLKHRLSEDYVVEDDDTVIRGFGPGYSFAMNLMTIKDIREELDHILNNIGMGIYIYGSVADSTVLSDTYSEDTSMPKRQVTDKDFYLMKHHDLRTLVLHVYDLRDEDIVDDLRAKMDTDDEVDPEGIPGLWLSMTSGQKKNTTNWRTKFVVSCESGIERFDVGIDDFPYKARGLMDFDEVDHIDENGKEVFSDRDRKSFADAFGEAMEFFIERIKSNNESADARAVSQLKKLVYDNFDALLMNTPDYNAVTKGLPQDVKDRIMGVEPAIWR